MTTSIVYDISHLLHRLSFPAPSGVENVDLAYASFFAGNLHNLCATTQYGVRRPIVFPARRVQSAVKRADERWRVRLQPESDEKYLAIRRWLLGESTQPLRQLKEETPQKSITSNIASLFRIISLSILQDPRKHVPNDTIYLNVAQHALEFEIFFRWLSKRPDLRTVFFIHDLLPLDHPEFWPPGYEARFRKRIDCAVKYGSAFLTASRCVGDRLRAELTRRPKHDVPIFTGHLPAPLENSDHVNADVELANVPYFLVIGTIEPRKNHPLLLNIWRELASHGEKVPKLILVGKRGWLSDQVVNLLDQAKELRNNVAEVSGLANGSLRRLIVNARAVLFPTFAEGFGLPMVEALSCGTPVLASDIPVLREVSQGCALFRNPLDGRGWLDDIRQLANPDSALAEEARAAAKAFKPVAASQYFSNVLAFLEGLADPEKRADWLQPGSTPTDL